MLIAKSSFVTLAKIVSNTAYTTIKSVIKALYDLLEKFKEEVKKKVNDYIDA